MSESRVFNIAVGDIGTNCWIYTAGDRNDLREAAPCTLIDPGNDSGRIVALLDQLNLFPSHILLTHGHFDHVGAVAAVVREFGRRNVRTEEGRPRIAIHSADSLYLGPGSGEAHNMTLRAMTGGMDFAGLELEEAPPADVTLADGDGIGPFTVVHLPGHTAGSVAFWDTKAGLLFSGDTLFEAGFGRTDLPGGSDVQLAESLKRLFAMDPGIRVYPGHGRATSIGNEAVRYPGIR